MSYNESSEKKCVNVLSLPQYQFWLDAIRNDNSHEICRVLETSNIHTKSKLLNGSFQFPEIPEVKRLAAKRPIFTHPFTLAAMYGSMGVCGVMLKYGVDVFLMEKEDFNVFHCLVCIAFCQPDNEESIAQRYTKLCSIIQEENVKTLLRMEDSTGLRPLEFAINEGTLKMMLTIFETPGVYKIREDIIGVRRYRWYDITEYETGDMSVRRRSNISPIQLLAFLDERHFYSEFGRHVFTESVIADWIRKSVQTKRFIIVCWFVLRGVYCYAFCVYQLSQISVANRYNNEINSESYYKTMNISSSGFTFCPEDTSAHVSLTAKRCLEAYLILQSLATVLYDTTMLALRIQFFRVPVVWLRDLSGKRKKIASGLTSVLEHKINLLFSLMVLVEIVIYNNPTKVNILFLTTMHICQAAIIIIAILHHMEIFHSIGHVIIYMKRLFTMLTSFATVCGGCVYVFTRLFSMISQLDGTAGCAKQFSDFSSGMYSTFLIFLNVFDVRDLSIDAQAGLRTTHICFVFVVGVLLYNLLIAMFTDEINKVSENKEVALCVDHLWTVGSIDTIGLNTPIVRSMYTHLNRASIKNNFACLEDKICLVSVDIARKRDIRRPM